MTKRHTAQTIEVQFRGAPTWSFFFSFQITVLIEIKKNDFFFSVSQRSSQGSHSKIIFIFYVYFSSFVVDIIFFSFFRFVFAFIISTFDSRKGSIEVEWYEDTKKNHRSLSLSVSHIFHIWYQVMATSQLILFWMPLNVPMRKRFHDSFRRFRLLFF